jgi:hypothetical protein
LRFVSARGCFSKKNLHGLIGGAKMSGPFERAVVGFCGFAGLENAFEDALERAFETGLARIGSGPGHS